MAIEMVKAPNIGGESDVEIIEISVKVGDTVAKDDTLITLESEKAAMDVPSPLAGVVKHIVVKLGDRISEGSAILERLNLH